VHYRMRGSITAIDSMMFWFHSCADIAASNTQFTASFSYCKDITIRYRQYIAKTARAFMVNSDHRQSQIDVNNVDFYDTTTLWCPSLNPVIGRYGTPL